MTRSAKRDGSMLFKDNQNFCDTIIQMTVACVASLDKAGRIVEFQSYLDKIPPKKGLSFIGKQWIKIFVPDEKENFTETFFENVDSLPSAANETSKILTSYENELFIEWNFIKVEASVDTTAGILAVGTDMTRHIELEQQLQHADRLATVGQLAAGVAHELNGPLNNILGYAQLSSKQQNLPEQVYQDLDNIVRFSLHAREIVKKVMLFSRQLPAGHERVNLNKIIEESLYFTEPLCSSEKLEIQCDLEKNLPDIKGDSSQLRQVVVNLVVNAAQAMSDKQGLVTVQTMRESKNKVSMVVRDTGSGMSPETLEQCFIPFFTTKDVDQGTGLGLSVVHGIVKSHNGAIHAHSTLGKGSSFHVTFPVNSEKGEDNG